jgi:hypothetical protein
LLSLQVFPVGQSLAALHSTGAPASSIGGTHCMSLQTVPLGQLESEEHVAAQPWVVQTSPDGQSALFVHEVVGGGATLEQPYPSQL